jgi:chaperonin GroES
MARAASGRVAGRAGPVLSSKETEEESSMAIKWQPIGDRVLVEPIKEKDEQKKGGIIIPDTAKEKPLQGTVMALGTGKVDEKGAKVPFNVKVGDKVLMPKYGGTEVKLDEQDYQVISESDLIMVQRTK